jgi:hypothetical protein
MFLHRLPRLVALAAVTASFPAGIQTSSAAAEPDASIFSGEIGTTVANQYITRGFVVNDEGVSFQPYLDLNAELYRGDGFIDSASMILGLWSVISSTPLQGTGGGGNRFTEFDYGLGFTVNFADRWSFTPYYNRWTSPAGAYDDGHWISAAIEFDDHGLIARNFSLHPFLEVLWDPGIEAASGLCFESGIRPNITLFSESEAPINAAVLVMTGLGSGYFGETYGYFATGPKISVPLTFIAPSLDRWSVSAEYLYYDFGSMAAEYNGRDSHHLVSFSLAVSF